MIKELLLNRIAELSIKATSLEDELGRCGQHDLRRLNSTIRVIIEMKNYNKYLYDIITGARELER